MAQQVVISTSYGGFGLSKAARKEMGLTKDGDYWEWRSKDDEKHCRIDPQLINTINKLGAEACSDRYASLTVVEIPDGVEWQIEEYDGAEWVAEKHRTWR